MIARDGLEGISGVHPGVIPDVRTGPACFRDILGVFEAEYHGTMAAQHRRIRGDCAHRGAHRVEDAFRIIALMIGDAVRRFGRDSEDRGVLGTITVLDVIWRERTVGLVFGNAVTVFAGVTEGALVEVRRPAPTNV